MINKELTFIVGGGSVSSTSFSEPLCFIDLGFSVKFAAYTTEVGGVGTTYCSRSRSKLDDKPFWVRLWINKIYQTMITYPILQSIDYKGNDDITSTLIKDVLIWKGKKRHID